MAFIRLPLGIRVAVEFEIGGKAVVNIYHVTTTDPIVQVKLETIAQIFAVWWTTNMTASLSHEVALTGVTALSLDVPNGPQAFEPVAPPVPGTSEVDCVPANVAMVVSLKTAQTGRSFQGRSYIAGLIETEVFVNEIFDVRVAAILAAFATLDAALAADNDQLVVASFVTDHAPRIEGIGTPVTSFAADTRVDTQRRRLPKA